MRRGAGLLGGGRSESHDGVNPSRARGRRGWKEQPALTWGANIRANIGKEAQVVDGMGRE